MLSGIESILNQASIRGLEPHTHPEAAAPILQSSPSLPACQDLQSAVQADLRFPGSIYKGNIDLISL